MTTEKVRPDLVEIVFFWLGIGCMFSGAWMLSPAGALILFGLMMFVLSVAWFSIRKSEASND